MKVLCIAAVLLFAPAVRAGDKIGNGGGLWVCAPDHEPKTAALVDFYEAETEFGLHLISPAEADPLALVDAVGALVAAKLPDYSVRWTPILSEVRAKIRFVNAELVVIDDALFRIRPWASLCRSGWEYWQFANYTSYREVLIRQDLWLSNAVSTRDKAGLIWHEAIYRWMRDEFGDKDSVRARQIVGLLFSDLEAGALRSALEKILSPDEASPNHPVWVCLLRNEVSGKFYYDLGPNELMTRGLVSDDCQRHETSLAYHCLRSQIRCDSFTSMQPRFVCAEQNSFNNRVFTEQGRSQIEAEAKARKACTDQSPPYQCESQLQCQSLNP